MNKREREMVKKTNREEVTDTKKGNREREK